MKICTMYSVIWELLTSSLTSKNMFWTAINHCDFKHSLAASICLDTSAWYSTSSRATPALLNSFTFTSRISLSMWEICKRSPLIKELLSKLSTVMQQSHPCIQAWYHEDLDRSLRYHSTHSQPKVWMLRSCHIHA